MKYRFFVNVEKDEQGRNVGFFGYEAGHALELAYQGEVDAPDDLTCCEWLFERFNIAHPVDYRNRSMSVGDVVVLDGGKAYTCANIGFREIILPENLPA
jgi:hypothetical protein